MDNIAPFFNMVFILQKRYRLLSNLTCLTQSQRKNEFIEGRINFFFQEDDLCLMQNYNRSFEEEGLQRCRPFFVLFGLIMPKS